MQELAARPLLYEVDLSIDSAIIAEYDAWLREHVNEMLALPGFLHADILTPESGSETSARRVVQYRLRDRAALDTYLEEHAPRMREQGLQRFGDRFSASRRILEIDSENETLPRPAGCPNCGSALVTRFCANCGQENRDYHIAFHRLILDFLGDNFTFDSRLFRSLRPLLLKPGQLTRDYMAGHRARHIPPLRMYLFISILFFALLGSSTDFDKLAPTVKTSGLDQAENLSEAERRELQKLVDQGILTAGSVALSGNGTADETSPDKAPGTGEREPAGDTPAAAPAEPAGEPTDGTVDNDADPGQDAEDGGYWDSFGELFTRRVAVYQQNPGLLFRDILRNLPVAMFLMLPIYALLLKLLYLFKRRYYMEHLIFAFHVHAFLFLVFSALLIWSVWIGPWLNLSMHGLLIAAITIWLMLYPWFAMRRNYGQGRLVTSLKYLLLGFMYFFVLLFGALGAIMAVFL